MPDNDKKKTMVKVAVKKPSSVELTSKFSKSQEAIKENLSKAKTDTVYDKTQGIIIDKPNMKATPKVFVRKVITTGGDTGITRIMADDGKTVKYEGRSNMQSTKEALRQNKNQSADTNSRRNENANTFNVSTGAKKDLTEDDKKRLVAMAKATPKE